MAQTGFTPIQIYSSSTAAAAPVAGSLTNSTLGAELAINITDGKLFYKDNANVVQVIGWKTVPIAAGGTGLSTYAAGDLVYYSSGTAFTKLAIGASTTIMTSNGAAPQWSAASSIAIGTATNLASGAQGSIPYQSAAGTTVFLAKNTTATRYLANTGASNNPDWAQINLANGVTGTLPVANGGTGITSLGTGVATWLGTPSSANLAAAVTDETGSGALVFGTSPTIATPSMTGDTILAADATPANGNQRFRNINIGTISAGGSSTVTVFPAYSGGRGSINVNVVARSAIDGSVMRAETQIFFGYAGGTIQQSGMKTPDYSQSLGTGDWRTGGYLTISLGLSGNNITLTVTSTSNALTGTRVFCQDFISTT